VPREVDRALAGTGVLATDRFPVMTAAAAAAAEGGEPLRVAQWTERAADELKRHPAPASDAFTMVIDGYALNVRDPKQGGARLIEGADALERIGQRLHLPPVLRDAGRWLARGGDFERARICFNRARALLAACGSETGLVRLDSIEAAMTPAAAPVEPRLHA